MESARRIKYINACFFRVAAMQSAVFLGRALPYARRAEQFQAFDEELPGRPGKAPALPRQQQWEYTPFGDQKKEREPLAPFRMAPEPDKEPASFRVLPEPDKEPASFRVLPESDREHAQEKPRTAEPEPETAKTQRTAHYAYDDLETFPLFAETSRARPSRPSRRLGRSVYDAMQTQGHFGLVDGGETLAGGVRRVVLHVPKRSRGYALDVRPGEVIYANSARGTQARGRLDVLYVSRHKYVPPGHAVTSCVIGVPEEQWARFLE